MHYLAMHLARAHGPLCTLVADPIDKLNKIIRVICKWCASGSVDSLKDQQQTWP